MIHRLQREKTGKCDMTHRHMKTIKDLLERSCSRKKLREKGVSTLTDEVLVSAIFGLGTVGVDVCTFARRHLLKDSVKIAGAQDVLPLVADHPATFSTARPTAIHTSS